jgi:hypothetical protein
VPTLRSFSCFFVQIAADEAELALIEQRGAKEEKLDVGNGPEATVEALVSLPWGHLPLLRAAVAHFTFANKASR